MSYREVTMIEVKEVLRLWVAGTAKKRIAAMLGLDPKTVRRYLKVATGAGVTPGSTTVSEAEVTAVLLALHPAPDRPHGKTWAQCETERAKIKTWLAAGIRLTKIRKLLGRRGVAIPYATLHRFAVAELGFGRSAPTVPLVDGEPGQEVQLDTGWVGWLRLPAGGRRRMRAWIFTAVRSRHRFVYPCFRETTGGAIEACEAAWAFFGGVFRVVIPDNTKAIIHTADALEPRLVDAFLEYAQARDFHVDPTRVRHPKDKARVERAVPGVRDDCFAGEDLTEINGARALARHWCLEDYGERRHSRTQRRPLEHFDAEERPALRPAPVERYDPPLWASPKIGRDHYAVVDRAFYTLPTRWIGVRLRARADRALVRFYHAGVLVKTHARQAPGDRAIDPHDFPPERTAYAMRDVTYLQTQADAHGEAVGRFVAALLDGPLPWTRMRRVYAVLSLARRYGSGRVQEACALALVVGMLDVHRLQRMLAVAPPTPAVPTAAAVPAPARFLRPATQYRLTLVPLAPRAEGDST
ncbi:MAG: transposase [Candidatus Atribacteria bacterium]|nr:transposase [Candidatus Atribacteria bacterium]MBE3071666.1 transposase [Acidobacteriota bacterium]MBE3099748.1 transposase [Planctomycetota bacterium]MBE3133419.1 transposase [Acidobacteriota bacterium]